MSIDCMHTECRNVYECKQHYNPRHVPAIIYDVVFVEGESIYIDEFIHDEHCLPYKCVAGFHASA